MKFRETKLSGQETEVEAPKRAHYPSLYLLLKTIPEARNWKPNETNEITLQVKVDSITINKSKDEESGSVRLEITGLAVGKKEEDKEKEEKSAGSYKER